MLRSVLCLFGLLFAAGCGAHDDTHGDAHSDAGTLVGCESDPRVIAVAPGLSVPVPGSTLALEVVSTTPTPPARGTNGWVVRLTSTDPAVAAAAQVAEVTPTMPDHGHGSSVKPSITRRPDGDYEIGAITLAMPGVWSIAFRVQLGDGTQATATLSICIDG